MSFGEAIIQFILAGTSVVLATIIGRRVPYLGALVLLFPVKVLTTLLFLPNGDKDILARFLVMLIPGLFTVAAFVLAVRAVIYKVPITQAFGVGLIAWAGVAGLLAFWAK